MPRIALLSSEPLRARMAGIGARYFEFARRLPEPGVDVVVVCPRAAHPPAGRDPITQPNESIESIESTSGARVPVRAFARGGLRALLADCDGAIAQGQLANDLVLEVPELPVVIDLYDPFLVENLHYTASLGLDPFRNDHATWVLQMARGDRFLCSSAEQRLYSLGFLTALGRVNPEAVARDPTLGSLLLEVPFGVPAEVPAHRPVLPPRAPAERRALFGALYDWYDPATVIAALRSLDRPDLRLLFVRSPNPGSTPQRRLDELVAASARERWLAERVQVIDWVPFERRWDLLRDVDLMVAAHRPGLESDLSLRTRCLDALAVGCPVVVTEGGALGRLLAGWQAGWTVPAGDQGALARALDLVLAGGPEVAARCTRGRERCAQEFGWDRVLQPLRAFCRRPERDPAKEAFTFRPATRVPAARLLFRLRRFARRLAGPGGAAEHV